MHFLTTLAALLVSLCVITQVAGHVIPNAHADIDVLTAKSLKLKYDNTKRNMKNKAVRSGDHEIGHCGTRSPSDEAKLADQARVEEMAKTLAKHRGDADRKVKIDVAFHVFHDGAFGMIDRGMIKDQIDVLNDAFKANNANFEFKLRSVDYTDDRKCYQMDAYNVITETECKARVRVGGGETLNIFSVAANFGILGWAVFPSDWPSSGFADGVAIYSEVLPGGGLPENNEGDVLVHEVGHWVGLYHTFETLFNDLSVLGGECAGPGDFVDDTPAEAEPARECVERDTCPDQPGFDPVENYMDYTPDACLDEFTPGQVERMRAEWMLYRDGQKATPTPLPVPVPISNAGAIPLACGDSVTGSTVGAPSPISLPFDIDGLLGTGTSGQVQYAFSTAIDLPVVSFSTCGTTDFDVELWLFSLDGTLIGTVDDSVECSPGTATLRVLDLPAGEYAFVVEGFDTEEGSYQLDVSCLETVAAFPAINFPEISCGEIVNGSTVGAPNDLFFLPEDLSVPGFDNAAQVGYSFSTSEDLYGVEFSTCNSADFDTALWLFDSNGNLLAFNDDGLCSGYTSLLQYGNLPAGDYVLVVEGFLDEEGDFTLSAKCIEEPERSGMSMSMMSMSGSEMSESD